MAAAAAQAAVSVLQMQTLQGLVKTLGKRVQAFEDNAPPAKRGTGAGQGHLSQHDLQQVNLMKQLGRAARNCMGLDEETAKEEPEHTHSIVTYFDDTAGPVALCTHAESTVHHTHTLLFEPQALSGGPIRISSRSLSRRRQPVRSRSGCTRTRSIMLWSYRTLCSVRICAKCM
jgi:hypothetical protein